MEMYTQGHISKPSHAQYKTAPCNLILHCRSMNALLYYVCFRLTQNRAPQTPVKPASARLQHFLRTNYEGNQNEYTCFKLNPSMYTYFQTS
jgi:hypothetical protein